MKDDFEKPGPPVALIDAAFESLAHDRTISHNTADGPPPASTPDMARQFQQEGIALVRAGKLSEAQDAFRRGIVLRAETPVTL